MRHPLKTHFKAQIPSMKPFVGARLRPRLSKVSNKRHHSSLAMLAYLFFHKGKKSHPRHSRDLDDEVSHQERNIIFILTIIRAIE